MELNALHLDNLKYSLFLKRRFLPIFMATFLGAFNDNLLRSGLIVLIAYSVGKGIALPARPEILVTICSGLLVLPMLLFSSIAGPVADKYEKSRLVFITKVVEMSIMWGAYWGFSTDNIYLLMGLLFVSGTHTTFYSPIKFSILPDHLKAASCWRGNGFMAGGSYLAIPLGMVTGGLLVEMPHNAIGLTAVSISICGLLASLLIPASKVSHPDTVIRFNIFKATCGIMEYAWRDKTIFLTILGLSWFMLLGSVYMSQFANYAQGVVHADNEVYILFLSIFSIGIAAGSTLCDTLLKGKISARLMPFAALGISVFTYLMVATTPAPSHTGLATLSEFISSPEHWPLLASLLMVAICGGIYIVPLYALLQSRAEAGYRSRVMAASNLSDSVFMTLAVIVSAGLLLAGLTIPDLFLIIAALNLVVVWYARKVIMNAGELA